MGYLALGCRLLLAGIFLASVGGKARGYAEFVAGTAGLLAISVRAARWLAALTVAAEAAIVLLLLVPATVPAGFAVATGTLAVFTYALVRALRRGPTELCRCFGASSIPAGPQHVVRNLVLIVLALAGLVATLSGGGETPGMGGIAVTGLVALVGVAVTARLDDLIDLFRPTPVR